MFVKESACVGCAACIAACRKEAISVFGVASIDQSKCTACGACALHCPNDAITTAGSDGDAR